MGFINFAKRPGWQVNIHLHPVLSVVWLVLMVAEFLLWVVCSVNGVFQRYCFSVAWRSFLLIMASCRNWPGLYFY